MSTSDLDNQLSRNATLKGQISLNLNKIREQAVKARIHKKNFINPNYYEGSFLNHHLIPVRQDLNRPFKLRKARKPYWRHQSPYGLVKPYNPVELRQYGNTWVVNQCKTIIISETLSADWEIVPTNEQDFSNDTMQKKRIIETFFQAVNRDGDTLKDILKPFINDALDLGMGIMVKGFVKDAYFNIKRPEKIPHETPIPQAFEWSYVPSKIKSGMLRELTTHDAGSFYNQPDEFGTTIGWWQWLNQSSPEFFSKREIIDFNFQPLSYNAYGISPVDVCKNLVNVLVTSVANMEQFMDDGAIPPAVGILQKISDRDFDIFADRWEAAVSGDPSDIPLMSTGEGGEFKFVPLVVNTDEIKQLETIDKYQKIVMSVFHVTPAELGWCYSDDTRTLTENGFKYYWEWNEGEKIAAVNPETREMEWIEPQGLYTFDVRDRKFLNYKNKSVDLLVSDNHKIWHTYGSKKNADKNWNLKRGYEILNSNRNRIELQQHINWMGTPIEEIAIPLVKYDLQARQPPQTQIIFPIDDYCEFMGYYLSDGSVLHNSNMNRIRISQYSDKTKIEKMWTLLQKHNFRKDRDEGFVYSNKSLCYYLRKFGKADKKYIPKRIKNLPTEQLQILMDALLLGDGHRYKNKPGATTIRYSTVSKQLADDVLEVMLKLGYAAHISIYNDNRNDLPRKTMYIVSGNKYRLTPKILVKEQITEENYSGIMHSFCLDKWHLYITERNGKIAIQTNTDAVNKASAEQQSQVQKRAAIFPLLDALEDLVNKYAVREFDPERALKFQWIKPKTKEEEIQEWDLIHNQLGSGFYTINMIKKKMGEPIVPWGNVPYSEALWTNLASEYDPSLFGFREEQEDANVAKITYAQTQVNTLLEQMQYGLQNDKDLTPIAVMVLNRLKLLNEAIQPRGSLSLPPSSVIETERMLDAMSRSQNFSSTSEIFNKYRRDELERFREHREKETQKMLPEATHKAVGVKGKLPSPFKNKLAFYTVMMNVKDGLTSKKYQDRIDRLHQPIEDGMTSAILTTFRTWYTKIKQFFGFYTKEDMLQKFPSAFISELEPVLNETMNKKEFDGILKNSFVDAFKIGFRTNNEGKTDKDTAKVSIKKYQPRAYDWLESNSLYFADKLIEEQQQQIKGIVLRGLGEAHDIPTITKSIQRVLAPEDEDNQKKVLKRAKMIARTEIIRASVQGALSQMKSLGATHWQHHTHFDERNVGESPLKDEAGNFLKIKGKKQTCRSLHGKIFKIDNPKDMRFLPPLHINGRCTILGVHKDKPKWRKRSKVTIKSAPKESKSKARKKIESQLEKIDKFLKDDKYKDPLILTELTKIKAELIIELFKAEGLWDEEIEDVMKSADPKLADCVKNKISKLTDEYPNKPHKEILGQAYGMCRDKLGIKEKALSEADIQVFIPEIIDKRNCFEKLRDKHPTWSMEKIKDGCADKK